MGSKRTYHSLAHRFALHQITGWLFCLGAPKSGLPMTRICQGFRSAQRSKVFAEMSWPILDNTSSPIRYMEPVFMYMHERF